MNTIKLKTVAFVVLISTTTSIFTLWMYHKIGPNPYAGVQTPGQVPYNYAGFRNGDKTGSATPSFDFTAASATATPAVVHIKTKIRARKITNNLPRRSPFSDLFGDDFLDLFDGPRTQIVPEQRASGSGVLISEDGYIVTNNHVIDNADEINITLSNKKTYKGTLVGTDPSSDLAVIKITGTKFPYLIYGNSDGVRLGQWVLAIGYPLTLDVTITAGIISAKARSLGINRKQSDSPIESFLQTDAAVNPGNSGGALINPEGELIGINSAIASTTGYSVGYSYAIPVNIVKKIVNDIIKFGTVQRAYLGINYQTTENLTDEQKLTNNIKEGEGVFIAEVIKGGAAEAAGLMKGDIITKIDNNNITSGPELIGQLAGYKPGDVITATFFRNGKEQSLKITLKNKAGNTDLVKTLTLSEQLGGKLETIDKKTAFSLNLKGGVVVKEVGTKWLKNTRIQPGFIILMAAEEPVRTVEDLHKILTRNMGETIKIEGLYPGYDGTYAYPLSLVGY